MARLSIERAQTSETLHPYVRIEPISMFRIEPVRFAFLHGGLHLVNDPNIYKILIFSRWHGAR